MKHFFIFISLFISITCLAQNDEESLNSSFQNYEDTAQNIVRYKLYPTTNMWTFIKLDTATGKTWQVQYSVEGDKYRFETPLWTLSQLSYQEKETNGRFILVPTKNIHNFIMLDQVDGRVWQVQWSQDINNRGCIRIN